MTSRHWDFVMWQQASDLIEQAERIQRNFLQVFVRGQYEGSLNRLGTWAPPVNVVETPQSWWVISALPGVEPNHLEVRVEGDELIISGTRPLPRCCSEGELKLWEIPLGRFERRLNLTPGVRFMIGETRLQDGLLTMELKKVS
ncbi:MAG: Hsp20/alpha crystallin family protein [Deltaproteobacteria bacterium]|nr:Hsp20/alpha crystallin family protein [Deltaproteobacteria bacterium]